MMEQIKINTNHFLYIASLLQSCLQHLFNILAELVECFFFLRLVWFVTFRQGPTLGVADEGCST